MYRVTWYHSIELAAAATVAAALTSMTVRDLLDQLRQAPTLSPTDSIARAIRVMRARGLPALLVAEGLRLSGLITESDVLAFAANAANAREALRETPLTHLMQPIPLAASLEADLTGIARELTSSGAPLVPVIGPDGRVLGLLLPRDILAAVAGEPVLPSVGGMATPMGVFLTTGALRAGASDLALAGTGASMAGMNLLAVGVISGLTWLLERSGVITFVPDNQVNTAGMIAAFVLYGLEMAIFLLLLRLSPLSRIHASEHMVVHAMEEGEDLTPENVKRLPRVHPRCGTNLIALLVLIVAGQEFLSTLPGQVDGDTQMLAQLGLIMIVLFTWRRLGAWLQRWVTTAPPAARQLQGAIGVAGELLERVRSSPSAQAGVLHRIWNRGIVQVLAGFGVVTFAAHFGWPFIIDMWRLITG